MTRYFITGATGYIGQALTKQLEKSADNTICALVKSRSGNSAAWNKPRSNFLEVNLEDRSFTLPSNLILNDSVLLDLAWDFSGRPNEEQVEDHVHLAAAAIKSGVQKIVSLGTLFELGFDQGEVNEDSIRLGKSVHGLAKSLLHDSLKQLCEQKGASLLWPRVHYVYGEDLRSRSIFGKILSTPKPFLLDPRVGKFDFIELDDLVKKIEFLLKVPSEGTIDIGSGEPQTFREFLNVWLTKNNRIPSDYLPEESESTLIQQIGTWPSLEKFQNLVSEFEKDMRRWTKIPN
jgi:nucleoside-diphosphate-sugar epimerase